MMDVVDNYYLPDNSYIKVVYKLLYSGSVTFIEFSLKTNEYFNSMNRW